MSAGDEVLARLDRLLLLVTVQHLKLKLILRLLK
jgi:hypothetical protein